MARIPRHTQTGEWHHVMNRGARRLPVFGDDLDRRRFLDRIEHACREREVGIHTYALLENHYHLLLRGPIVEVSEFMRTVASDYTIRFNRRYGLDGPLFRGRFRSRPVHDDVHLKELVRYIHRNPLGDSSVPATLRRLRWTSHPSYIDAVDKPWWLQTEQILSIFADDVRRYRLWVEGDESSPVPTLPSPATRCNPRPCTPVDIDKAVGVSSAPEHALITSASRLRRRHRDAAIALCSDLTDLPADRLAEHFGLASASSYRSAATRARSRARRDRELAELIEAARLRLIGRPSRRAAS